MELVASIHNFLGYVFVIWQFSEPTRNGHFDFIFYLSVSEGVSMGAPDVLEVLDPSIQIRVNLQVPVHLPSLISQLPPRETHGPCKEKICPLRREHVHVGTQKGRSRGFSFVRNRPIVCSMEVDQLELLVELGLDWDAVVVATCACRFPELVIVVLHRDQRRGDRDHSVERTIPIGLQEQPIDHGRPVARSQDGHVVPVHHGVLCHHLVDQVDDEGDVVGLALLVEHVPAPLVAVGRHHDHLIS